MTSRNNAIFEDIISAFSHGKRYLSISEVAQLCGHHRHTVARYLDSLVLSGRLEMREHGQKKKYYIADVKPESSLLNFSSHILIILNTDLTIRWVNDTFLRLFNSTSESVIGLSIESLQLERIFGPAFTQEVRIVSAGETRSFETSIDQDDNTRTYLFTISSVSFFQERPALVINGEDITEKHTLLEAIRVNESNLRLITESVRDIIIRWDVAGTISYVSPACAMLTGFVSQEIKGRNISEFIHPDDYAALRKELRDVSGFVHKPPASFRFRNLNGEWIWFETTTTPLLSESGEIEEYISVWRDITERLEAETRLALSEEKYRRLFQSAKDAIILMKLESDLSGIESLEMNNNACLMIQYSQSEFSSLGISDIVREEDYPLIEDIIRTFIENRQAFFEIDLIRRDGSILPVEVNVHLFSLQEKPVALAIARDITERRRIEAEIQEALLRLEYILEFLPDPVFVLDTNGVVTGWNREIEDLTGVPKHEIIGKAGYAYTEALYGENVPILPDYILTRDSSILSRYKHPVIEGDTIMVDIQTRNPVTGVLMWFWIKAAPLYDIQGNVIGVIETLRDITARKLMELEIKRQNEIFEAISQAGSNILQSTNFQDCVQKTIRLIGEAADVSGICLFEKKRDSNPLTSIPFKGSWFSDPYSYEFSRFYREYESSDGTSYQVIKDLVTEGKTAFRLVKNLPELDQVVFDLAGIASILLVPVIIDGEIRGCVGFLESKFERVWSKKEIYAMEIASSLIGSTIVRFQSREALARSERQFRTLAQNIPGIVFRISLSDSDVEFYNDHFETLTGYSAKELASGQISSLIPLILAEEKDQVIQTKMNAIISGEPYDLQYRIIDKQGRVRMLSERGRPVSDESGRVVSIDGIIQDITDQQD
ncbi:MAG TPA: PAS domain S-box protein [Methanospirillum sp.]|uniref:PAS domain S-box protein n=1 Tax=Methanospirillum sp. TaxID=45200 RepID=UPI002C1BAB2F|nr:PAS domain S-box protein [Methanospirillum sp.]HWQ62871.1 PAS domain S-box protein [Methanospirillum sp.]